MIIGSVLSGEEFKRLNKGKKFYKLTTFDELHNGFQFRDNLNVDIVEFNPLGECKGGGMYFADFENIFDWITYGSKQMYWIREVRILNDSKVYIESGKFKTDKFALLKRKSIYDNEEYCKIIVKKNGWALEYVKNQTDEICKLAVQKYGLALSFVKKQTPEICKLAVQKTYTALAFVEHQTDEICKLALEQTPYALYWIKNQTDEICKIAVEKDETILRYIKRNDSDTQNQNI